MSDAIFEQHDQGLRSEIIESQKTQAEFLKWKLIAVATLASISLGLTTGSRRDDTYSRLLVCLVPLICAYVDLTSLHIMIRIITIGAYLKKMGNPYESFVFRVRDTESGSPFVFEPVALHGSSLAFNLIIAATGLAVGAPIRYAYVASGLVGAIATGLLWLWYTQRARVVMDLAAS